MPRCGPNQRTAAILGQLSAGKKQTAIAKEFDISKAAVSSIWTRYNPDSRYRSRSSGRRYFDPSKAITLEDWRKSVIHRLELSAETLLEESQRKAVKHTYGEGRYRDVMWTGHSFKDRQMYRRLADEQAIAINVLRDLSDDELKDARAMGIIKYCMSRNLLKRGQQKGVAA